jgi:hypothetical protein
MWVQVLQTNREQNSGKLVMRSLGRSWKSVQMQRLGARIVKTYGHYVSLVSFDSEVLQKVKKSKMDKAAIKDLVYGGLEELMNNNRYYYHSSVGSAYSHLTEDGKAAVSEFMDLMAWKIKECNNADLNERAKQQVIAELKK